MSVYEKTLDKMLVRELGREIGLLYAMLGMGFPRMGVIDDL